MKILFLLWFFSSLAFAQSDVFYRSRGLNSDLQLCVNDGGTEHCPVLLDGVTGTLTVEDNATDDTALTVHANKNGSYEGTVLKAIATRGPTDVYSVIEAFISDGGSLVFAVQGDGETVLTIQADGSSGCPDGGNICSGQYTPTLDPSIGGGNCVVSAGVPADRFQPLGDWMWARVGNIVTVSGRVDLNCNSGTTLLVEPPIATDFNTSGDMNGHALSFEDTTFVRTNRDDVRDAFELTFSGSVVDKDYDIIIVYQIN